MTTKKSKSDRSLTKLKVTLATGGLMATLIGAGLLGNQASSLTVDATASTTTMTKSAATISTGSTTTTNINTSIPEGLNLNLEAIPTVAAPTFRGMAVANGRSSG